jgi:hypothetical protein
MENVVQRNLRLMRSFSIPEVSGGEAFFVSEIANFNSCERTNPALAGFGIIPLK